MEGFFFCHLMVYQAVERPSLAPTACDLARSRRGLVQKANNDIPRGRSAYMSRLGRKVRHCRDVINRRYRRGKPAYNSRSSLLSLVSTRCQNYGKVAILPLRYRQLRPHRGSRIRLTVPPRRAVFGQHDTPRNRRRCARAGRLGRGVVEDQGSGCGLSDARSPPLIGRNSEQRRLHFRRVFIWAGK